MKTHSVHIAWKAWFHGRALLLSVCLGLFGTLTLWADMRIPQITQFNIAADMREIFVVVGAWYGGPLGGLLAGAFSALYSPASNPLLHFSTAIAHALAGLALELSYQPGRTALKGAGFVLAWVRAILVYYLTLLGVISLVISLLVPSFFPGLAGGDNPLWSGYLTFFSAVLPEFVVVLLMTLVMMLALPGLYRKPLWDVDKGPNP
jgi:hypothetical protein